MCQDPLQYPPPTAGVQAQRRLVRGGLAPGTDTCHSRGSGLVLGCVGVCRTLNPGLVPCGRARWFRRDFLWVTLGHGSSLLLWSSGMLVVFHLKRLKFYCSTYKWVSSVNIKIRLRFEKVTCKTRNTERMERGGVTAAGPRGPPWRQARRCSGAGAQDSRARQGGRWFSLDLHWQPF